MKRQKCQKDQKQDKTRTTEEIISAIKDNIEAAAKYYKTRPNFVTKAQFLSVAKDVSEWELRKVGGLSDVKSLYFQELKPNEKAPIKGGEKGLIKKIMKQTPKLLNFTAHEFEMGDLFKRAKLKDDEVFRMVALPDVHAPDHDPDAVNTAIKFLEFYKPHGLIMMGDFIEMESVAHWPQYSPKSRRLIPEIKEAIGILENINKAAGDQCKFKSFLIGNHEVWLQQYLVERIPEVLDGLEDLSISIRVEHLLGLSKYGYEVIPFNEILSIGQANFIHGYYVNQHHAKKHLDVFGVNLYYAHTHSTQSHSGVSVKGVHEAMSIGCLRTLQAPFQKGKPNNWNHSLLVLEYRKDGSYTRYNPIMTNGKMSFMGKVF